MNAADAARMYACPACAHALVAHSDVLVCDVCGASYPLVQDIPRFVPPENYAHSFGMQWRRHARAQLDSQSGLTLSHDRFFAVTRWPRDCSGQRVLEVGSGAGRFTEVILETGAELYTCDYSDAVEANAHNHSGHPRWHLFQADMNALPFPRASFDKVVCLGVLQHTPDPLQSFRSLTRMVKDGGELAVDVYRKDARALVQWKYLLRPITRRMDAQILYDVVVRTVDVLRPLTCASRRWLGHAGARLSPIAEYSHLSLSDVQQREWAILDTYDMYAPRYDRPQTVRAVRQWFDEAGFEDVVVERGPNGVIGRGRAPLLSKEAHNE